MSTATLKKATKKNKDLGIFYTPEVVVDFIYSILNTLKVKEDEEKQRWQSRKPRPHYPSVIDPAVGEGLFLKKAIEAGFTKKEFIFGLDIDEEVVKRWTEINLLNIFNGNINDLEAHFFHQNGLDKIHWEQHRDKYSNRLKKQDIESQQFDTVVGNPPYGGIGIYDDMKQLSKVAFSSKFVKTEKVHTLENLFGEFEEKIIKNKEIITEEINLSKSRIMELKSLSKALLQLQIWQKNMPQITRINRSTIIKDVNLNYEELLTFEEIDKLKSFPIEVLFIDRFIQLAKPGGWIAVVIPDGILANSNQHYVREYISRATRVLAIVSLPRDTFKHVGTNAKTSILFLQKNSSSNNLSIDYPVFLSVINKLEDKYFKIITETFKEYLYG